jgi:hypothetical protein
MMKLPQVSFNRRLAQWRVKGLIEHLPACLQGNPPERKARNRYAALLIGSRLPLKKKLTVSKQILTFNISNLNSQ